MSNTEVHSFIVKNPLVSGDARELAIANAEIIARAARERYMQLKGDHPSARIHKLADGRVMIRYAMPSRTLPRTLAQIDAGTPAVIVEGPIVEVRIDSDPVELKRRGVTPPRGHAQTQAHMDAAGVKPWYESLIDVVETAA